MRICITRGIYGFRQSGNVVEKTSSSAPFEVDEEEGRRLIELNVARRAEPGGILEGRVALPEEGEESRGGGEDNVEDNIPGKRLEDMTIEELRQLAGETGIRKSGSREQLLERLRQNSDMGAEETLEEAEIPELTAEEPQ